MNKTYCWVCAILTSFLIIAAMIPAPARAADQSDDDANYDRLDGHGASGKKVDVVEWEGNLEIHVAPKGSLKGLSLVLDKRNKDKPVMVIGYRFRENPSSRLIRRAILGIDIREGFKTYLDPTEPDYDKIMISMNGLGSPLVSYKVDPPPAQLYPDGHPALKQLAGTASPDPGPGDVQGVGQIGGDSRTPASRGKPASDLSQKQQDREDSGTIQPFNTH